MAEVFHLPDLGEGLTEAAIVSWHVAVGDVVAIDQVIAEVETAKSIVELPSPFAGTILALHGDEGEVVNVGAPFIEVGSGSVSVPDDARELENYREEERAGSGSGNVLIGYGTSSHGGAPQRRRASASRGGAASVVVDAPAGGADSVDSVGAAGVAGVADSAVSAGGAPASVTAPEVPSPGAPAESRAVRGPVAVKSPIVRQLAKDLGVDVRALAGTGTDGVITRADVLEAARLAGEGKSAVAGGATGLAGAGVGVGVASAAGASAGATAGGASVAGSAAPAALAEASREPMSLLRRTVSAKMSTSRREIPEATVWVDVDITDLWTLRKKMATDAAPAPSFTALAARFMLMALAEFPLLASRIDGNDIVTFDGVNLGVAADTDRGLMVPVLPRADALSIAELDAQLRSVAAEARTGRLAPDRLTGSTVTLNNYGALGVDGSAAIINHPEVAIVGFGRAIERPWVVDGEIVARRIVQLSLVFDHRVCDGGYAAGFIRHLVTSLENPLARFAQL